MAKNEMWDTPDIVPEITYTDLARAIEWIQRAYSTEVCHPFHVKPATQSTARLPPVGA